jgi:hypothetical protein
VHPVNETDRFEKGDLFAPSVYLVERHKVLIAGHRVSAVRSPGNVECREIAVLAFGKLRVSEAYTHRRICMMVKVPQKKHGDET